MFEKSPKEIIQITAHKDSPLESVKPADSNLIIFGKIKLNQYGRNIEKDLMNRPFFSKGLLSWSLLTSPASCPADNSHC
jgi:hypothetical protein